MAVWHMDSCNHLATADILAKWPAGAGYQSIVTGVVGNGIFLNSASGGNVWYQNPTGSTSVWCAFDMKFTNAYSDGYTWLQFGDTLYKKVHLQIHSSHYMKAWRGPNSEAVTNNYCNGTELGTGTFYIAYDTWYHFQVEVTVDGSAGIVKTWINGVADLNLTGQNTLPTGGVATVTRINFWGGVGVYDNFVYGDASGSSNIHPPGVARVDCHFPVSPNGSDSEWTRSAGSDNWTLVDDTAASTGTSDYIESTAVGDQTSFHVEALKVAGGTMYGVQAIAYLAKMNAGPGVVKPYVLRGGTRYYGPEWAPSFGMWRYFKYVWDQDPAAGPGAWTESNFNNSEFGLERTA